MATGTVEGYKGDEAFTEGFEKMVEWRVAWSRAIARSWADDYGTNSFLNLLLTKPHEALKDVGWTVPKGLKIVIEEVDDAAESYEWDEHLYPNEFTADPAKTDENGKPIQHKLNGWAYEQTTAEPPIYKASERTAIMVEKLTTKVTLTLPPKPKTTKLQALALADYDGLSRAYPFTCCCMC